MPYKDPDRARAYLREWQKRNRDKCNAYTRAWNEKNPEKHKAIQNKSNHRRYEGRSKEEIRDMCYRQKYGLTLDQVEEMYEVQGGRCAICQRPLDRYTVDHDHETNKVRGLLCTACNTGIGHLGDSIEMLERALDYLRCHTD